jgi:enoyl-CoA hydratase
MTQYQTILVETRERVGVITLNRPDAMNALSTPLMAEVVQAIDVFEKNAGIGAIILWGGEKVFAAGADIKEMADKTFADMLLSDSPHGREGTWKRFSGFKKPIIAAVSGYALGGGCELALACDFIVCSDTAKFGQPEINLGTMPGAGGTQRLTRIVGKARAMELCLTGRFIDASEAYAMGIVVRVVPVEALFDDVLKTAKKISLQSLPAVYLVKEAINVADESTLTEGLRFERRAFQSTFATEDRKEGMAAFGEKRRPNFLHK